MISAKEKAEAYVRQQLPELIELSFGCELRDCRDMRLKYPCVITHYLNEGGNWKCGDGMREGKVFFKYKSGSTTRSVSKTEFKEKFEIIGHPIQLHHFLSVLPSLEKISVSEIDTLVAYGDEYQIHFDFTTGQPATEADYQAFCNIVGM